MFTEEWLPPDQARRFVPQTIPSATMYSEMVPQNTYPYLTPSGPPFLPPSLPSHVPQTAQLPSQQNYSFGASAFSHPQNHMNLQPYYPDHYESTNAPPYTYPVPMVPPAVQAAAVGAPQKPFDEVPSAGSLEPQQSLTSSASHRYSYSRAEPSVLEKIQLLLPPPPLSKAPLRPDSSAVFPGRRTKRKSKFTKEQDQLIVSLKRQGRSWVEIADIANVGSYLTARNRYQVIVGQQGSAHLCPWSQDNKMYLQRLLDGAELAKWDFIAKELSKQTGKHFTSKECREYARFLLFSSPESMGVTQRTVSDLEREHEITEKIMKQSVL
ncbi:hypothetical protein FDK38_004685 [Candidozyma auris]|nr:hypothetical protein FDK38_004685 [[Candida] auris]